MTTSSAGHFLERFRHWTATRPDHPAVVFVSEFDGGCGGPQLTYRELDARARAMAHGLAVRRLAGERVLILQGPGLEFAVTILACFLSGAIGTPAPVPEDSGRGDDRLAGIVRDAEVRHVLTTEAAAPTVRAWLERAGLADRVACLTEAELRADEVPLPGPDPYAVAFLQYTSGSTSEPKGVLVTHASLAQNESEIERALGIGADTRIVSWLPHYHDMGLVGLLLTPLYCGGTSYQIAPATFLRRPHRWLQAVSELRGDITVAPDFGYALVTRRTTDDQLAGLDLSRLRVAMNGSEPIHAATLERFAARFAPAGLDPAALTPCYGMAETTLFVSCTPPGSPLRVREVDAAALEAHRLAPPRPGEPRRRLVGSGVSVDLEIRVVDPETGVPLPDGAVGEIWLTGGSVATGYWCNQEATHRTFRARLRREDGGTADDRPYLRTGDLGCLLDGELYVTGRIKEMLIVNGRNLYPQDLERTGRESHPAFGDGAGAVFTVETGDERAPRTVTVAVQEIQGSRLREHDPAELVAALRRSVLAEYEVHLGDVVFVPKGSVARTTSGKIRRTVMREQYRTGGLRELYRAAAAPGTAAPAAARTAGSSAGAR